MKMTTPAAATALASLCSRQPLQPFDHMTNNALESIDEKLIGVCSRILSARSGASQEELNVLQSEKECHRVLARACIRRIAYRCLDKYKRLITSSDVVEDALKYYTLPLELQNKLAKKYGSNNFALPPTTWYEALEQLKLLARTPSGTLDRGKLWRFILEHPMTAYIPVQCQQCGNVVHDQYPLQQTDEEVGLKELQPIGDELEMRAGWFRGPRKAVVFELTCPQCHHVSNWYRSGHPKVILNPNKWGRLCGDQEDLRLTLAEYLNIPVRLIFPLDWDHVWSEYQQFSDWEVHDGSARNFCRRLDEGIGSWTRVWAIHPNEDWCQDVTQDYLKYKQEGGRVDDHNDGSDMERYRKTVQDAQMDETGGLTQAKTYNAMDTSYRGQILQMKILQKN